MNGKQSQRMLKSEDTKECPCTSRKSGRENVKNEVVRVRVDLKEQEEKHKRVDHTAGHSKIECLKMQKILRWGGKKA